MLLSHVAYYWLKVNRWSILLSPGNGINIRKLIPSMMVGAAGNNLLPAHMGELIRVYFSGEELGIPKSTVLATLIVERLFDIVAIIVLISISFLFMGDLSRQLLVAGLFLLVVAVIMWLASLLLSIYTSTCIKFIRERFTLVPTHGRERLIQQVINLSTGLTALRSRHLYFKVTALSLAQWLFMAGSIYLSLLAFDINVSPFYSIIILGLTVAGLTLPTSPGFFGTIEYCFVIGLAAVGVEANVAISVAIFYHVPVWATVTLVGLLLLRVDKLVLWLRRWLPRWRHRECRRKLPRVHRRELRRARRALHRRERRAEYPRGCRRGRQARLT